MRVTAVRAPGARRHVRPGPPPLVSNNPEWRRAEIPAGNGHATARGVARIYAAIAATTQDAELCALAGEFAAEEAQHVLELERIIASRTAA